MLVRAKWKESSKDLESWILNFELMALDVNIKITDRNGVTHEVAAPTDMAMNLMEIVKLYELAEEGTIGDWGGMAMCAS